MTRHTQMDTKISETHTCRVAFLQNLNVAIVNGVPLKQHVQLHQLPCIGTPFIAFRIAPSPPR